MHNEDMDCKYYELWLKAILIRRLELRWIYYEQQTNFDWTSKKKWKSILLFFWFNVKQPTMLHHILIHSPLPHKTTGSPRLVFFFRVKWRGILLNCSKRRYNPEQLAARDTREFHYATLWYCTTPSISKYLSFTLSEKQLWQNIY
jgi:hypothetical protein